MDRRTFIAVGLFPFVLRYRPVVHRAALAERLPAQLRRFATVDDFDKLAMSVASELLRSEAESPGSQDANLVKLAEAVLNNVGIAPDACVDTVTQTPLNGI
jgi:hypothetical protein